MTIKPTNSGIIAMTIFSRHHEFIYYYSWVKKVLPHNAPSSFAKFLQYKFSFFNFKFHSKLIKKKLILQ